MSEAINTKRLLDIAVSEEGFSGTVYPGRISERTTRPYARAVGEEVILEAKGLEEPSSTWTITLTAEEAIELYHELGKVIGGMTITL